MVERQRGCPDCQDLGYRTSGKARWAKAMVCDCQRPCPACRDEGQVITRDAKGLTWATTCEQCGPLHRRVELLNAAHIPAAYHAKTVEPPSFQPRTRSQSEVQRWLMRFQAKGKARDGGILIMGPPGVGKTHLLCAVLRFLTLERGMRARYIDSFALLQELRSLYEEKGRSAALMDTLVSVPVLGLDELGKTRTTGWQREVLDQIISRRYEQQLTTFVTSNYRRVPETGTATEAAIGHDTLEDRVGARIYSRLMEMCRPSDIEGPDRRQV